MPNESNTYRRPAIAGSGAIASGLAATATTSGEAVLLARSDSSAERAEKLVAKFCSKLEGSDPSKLNVTTDRSEVAGCDLLVESVVEDLDVKGEFLSGLAELAPEADLATTTSSLSIAELGNRCGDPGRLFGLHVFNPVPKMNLIEVCFPEAARQGMRERALGWCEAIGKTAVEVPDEAGFVVNRLLFPYLFDAVRLLDRTGMEPADVDACMKLGAGHPMGPLELLDLVGLDVSKAIGDAIAAESGIAGDSPPDLLVSKCEAGELGRKTGKGFYTYD